MRRRWIQYIWPHPPHARVSHVDHYHHQSGVRRKKREMGRWVGYGSVKTATEEIPSFLHEAMTRQAISPRFAINTLFILGRPPLSVGSGGICSSCPVFLNISVGERLVADQLPLFIGRVNWSELPREIQITTSAKNLAAFARSYPHLDFGERRIGMYFLQ